MTDDETTRDDWIARALEAWEGKLLRYAQGLLADPERARDAVQESFLRLCRASRTDVEARLGPWLLKVCRNVCTDLHRKEHTMRILDDRSPDGPGGLGEVATQDAAHDPAEASERRDTSARILGTLQRLPANQREVLRLKFQEGLSYREIAEVTGHAIGHVGWLIHHGLRGLRERLGVQQVEAKGSKA